MFTRRSLVVFVAMGALLVAFAIGCGPKPPCPVGPEVVKEAQATVEQVQSDLSQAEAERERLEKELSEKQAKLESLKGKPETLEKKLDALKKGSGR